MGLLTEGFEDGLCLVEAGWVFLGPLRQCDAGKDVQGCLVMVSLCLFV
jgi:hypothetical protein